MPRYRILPGLSRAVLAACLTIAGLAASEHHGIVEAKGLPVPGATVTASQGDQKLVTTSDDQGAYSFANLPDGIWTIQVDMFGFARLSKEVGIAPGAPSPTWQLSVLSVGALKQELANAAPKPAPKASAQAAQPAPTATASTATPPPGTPGNSQRAGRGGFGGGFRGARGGRGGQPGPAPSIREALAQNGYQSVDVNQSADGAALDGQAGNNVFGNDGATTIDLNQSASDALVVNGSVSSGLNLPQQNDWFGFGRGFNDGFGPGGPGGPGGDFGPPDAAVAGGPAGPGGPGGGPGGFGGGGRGGRGGGGFGGGRGGFRGGRGGRGRGGFPPNFNAFGNGRRNRRRQYNGNLALILNNSALNAQSYSLTGQATPKPAYARFRTTAVFGGPLKIPHLVSGENTTFTLNFQLQRSRNGNTLTSLMPTAAEQIGDFSQALNPLTGQPVTIIDPTNQTPFTNNQIPQARLDPVAQNLLKFYPAPNFISTARYNYQIPVTGIGNQNNLNARINHTINAKNQINGNLAWQSSDTSNPNLFQFIDSTHMTGINSGLNYTYHFTARLISNLRYNFSRQATTTTPFFANTANNVSGTAGILGNDQAPTFYGPPSLSFATGFAGLSDGNYALNHNTTQQIGDNLIWVHGSHNITFGGDFRRLDFNQISQANPRGSFNFTTTYTGFDFADFLLGLPTTSSIAYGNADKYFRASWVDLLVNDDWRINSRLSLNAGLRWDFQAPVTELYNRLVNLAVGPGFGSITPVCGTSAPGCTPASTAGYPNALVRPNYREFQPRIGLAWRPFTKDSTVIRAGYGLYYNTSVYQQLAAQMAQQSPLSFSVTQSNSLANPFDLATAFTLPAINSTAQTFALDPNFQVGYLHYWQLAIQHNLPASMFLTVTYNGNKGTHQVQEFLPNSVPGGAAVAPLANPLSGYVYETSGGNSNYNAVSVQLQRRFRGGLSGFLLYTYSKAIDDAQGVGGRGGAGSYAQNWMDLAAERSLSSFNRAQTLNLNMQWSTGQGARGGGLLTGWKGALLKDWTVQSSITLGSGLPLTPISPNRIAAGTGILGTVRADYTGGSLAPTAPGYGFNTAAFAPAPAGLWGTAGRNIITGPGQFSLNGSMGRVFRVDDRRNFDLRFDATNALNHVTFTSWNTTVGGLQFGLPTGAAGMRTLQATLRFRF